MDQELSPQTTGGNEQPAQPASVTKPKSRKVLGTIFFSSIVMIILIIIAWETKFIIPSCEGMAAIGCWAVLAGVLVTLIVIASVTAWLFLSSLLQNKLVNSGQVDSRHRKRITVYRYLIPAFVLDLLWLQENDMFAPNLKGFFIFVLILIIVAMIVAPFVVRADPQSSQDTR